MSVKPQSVKSQSTQAGTNSDVDGASEAIDSSASSFDAGSPAFPLSAAAAVPGFQTPAFQATAQLGPAPYTIFSAVSSFATAVVPSLATPTTISSTSGATGTGAITSSAVPSWVSALSTASIAADMAAADVNGTVTYAGLVTLLSDLDATLSSTGTALTAAELADLKTVAANLNNGMTTSSYLTGVMVDLVNGSAANATWTGGAAAATALGNLAAGSSATELSELIGKWFLGTDLPSSNVSMDGSNFSVSYSTSAKPVFAASGPSMNDINQGYLGDCYLLAGLAEVAGQNPGLISSMFTSNGNNTYGVRFYVNGVANYVTVNNSLANGGNEFNAGTDIWGSLAEKAYAQLQAGGVFTGNTSVNYGNSWSTIGNGGAPEYALEEITGASEITDFGANGSSWYKAVYNSSLSMTSYSSGISTASVLSTLVSDLAMGDDLVLSSWTNATDSSGRTTLVASHALSIYGYDTATGMLEIRNPWGTSNGQYWDTTFEISLATLLADGDTISVDNVGTGGNGAASPPVLSAQTAAQTWKRGQAVNFTLASNTFTDPQGSKLTYSATLSSGAALPSWLSFDGATGTFSGTVASSATGLSVKVTATDTSGLSASETFSVATPAPAAPILTAQTATQTWKLGQAVNFALASNTFTDPQAEQLTYSAKLASGAALPSWLRFDATTLTFTGTVPNSAAGLSIKVTATDLGGASSSETFSALTPAAAPVLSTQTASQTWKRGQAFSFTLSANTFTDPQTETLTYTAKQANGAALPAWLSFNGATRTFSGTVASSAAGLSVKVTATDTSGLSASETFSIATPAPAAPILTAPTASQTWKLGQAVNFALASDTFTDPQAEQLTYSARLASGAALPSWLRFNAATRTFAGTVPNSAAGLSIKVTATDLGGASSSETFSVLTPAAAPVLSAQTADQTWKPGQTVNFKLSANTFTDPQKERLTYSATLSSGAALPTWLKFNGVTDTFTGTAPSTTGSIGLKVTATDTSGLSVSETFTASIAAAASQFTQTIASLTSGAGSGSASPTHLVSGGSPTLASPAH